MTSQLRMRTRGTFVCTSISSDDGDNVSLKWYGPFATAQEQRDFMRSFIEDAPISDGEKEKFYADICTWRRDDEDSD